MMVGTMSALVTVFHIGPSTVHRLQGKLKIPVE